MCGIFVLKNYLRLFSENVSLWPQQYKAFCNKAMKHGRVLLAVPVDTNICSLRYTNSITKEVI